MCFVQKKKPQEISPAAFVSVLKSFYLFKRQSCSQCNQIVRKSVLEGACACFRFGVSFGTAFGETFGTAFGALGFQY